MKRFLEYYIEEYNSKLDLVTNKRIKATTQKLIDELEEMYNNDNIDNSRMQYVVANIQYILLTLGTIKKENALIFSNYLISGSEDDLKKYNAIKSSI